MGPFETAQMKNIQLEDEEAGFGMNLTAHKQSGQQPMGVRWIPGISVTDKKMEYLWQVSGRPLFLTGGWQAVVGMYNEAAEDEFIDDVAHLPR